MSVSGWCLWTYGVCVWVIFLWASFLLFSGPWLGTTTLLWGGVVMRLHLGRLFIFILLWPFSVFSRIVGTMGFLCQPLGACPRGEHLHWLPICNSVLAERVPRPLSALHAHQLVSEQGAPCPSPPPPDFKRVRRAGEGSAPIATSSRRQESVTSGRARGSKHRAAERPGIDGRARGFCTRREEEQGQTEQNRPAARGGEQPGGQGPDRASPSRGIDPATPAPAKDRAATGLRGRGHAKPGPQ